jgi:hypothetical protein
MKFRLSIWLLALAPWVAAPAMGNDFCTGYKEGYKAGYEQTSMTTLPTQIPLCPPKPRSALDDPKSAYKIGYESGFQQGIRDATH